MANLFLDFAGGNDANDGTTFANRVLTITSGATAARQAPGDIWRIKKTPAPVSLGINATFTNKSDSITLASALTANISLCQAAWTASANITTTTSSTRKEGTLSTSIAVAPSFTTGLMAYETIASTDFSAYSKISFHIRSNTALSASILRIDLCSDTAGATPVNSFTIDVVLSGNQWVPLTYNNGGALGAAIQSVAIVALSDPGTPTILIDNIIACNNLTLTSLISKDSSETSFDFWPIKSINGTAVKTSQGNNSDASATARGYYGTTETVAAYIREPVNVSAVQSTNEAGTAGNLVTFSGGWDTTNMTTQEGLTFVRCIAATNNVFSAGHGFIKFDRVVVIGAATGVNVGSNNIELGDIGLIDNTTGVNFVASTLNINISGDVLAIASSANAYVITNNIIIGAGTLTALSIGSVGFSVNGTLRVTSVCRNAGSTGIAIANTSGGNISDIPSITVSDCSGTGVSFASSVRVRSLSSTNNTVYGISHGDTTYVYIQNLTTSGNSTASIRSDGGGQTFIDNSSLAEATKISQVTNVGARVQISRWEGVEAQDRIYEQNVLVIQQQATVRHTAADVAWQYDPQSIHGEFFPLEHKLGYIAQDGAGSITAKLWVRRSNSAGTIKFVCRGGQTAGVATDQIATISAAIDTWEELSLTFTPTDAVPLLFEVWTYGTGTLYADDFTVV